MSIRPPMVDPCTDPANTGTQYCLTRRPTSDGFPETPTEWSARRSAELASGKPLEVTVNRAGGWSWDPLPFALVGLLLIVLGASKR